MKPLKLRSQVLQIQSYIRSYIGEGVEVTLEWNRSGAQTFPLLGNHPDQWTREAVLGRIGAVTLSADGGKLPLENLRLAYEIANGNVSFDLHGQVTELSPSMTVGSSAVGVVGVGSLMAVVSLVSFVWQLINFQITLTLPGSVGCQMKLIGETLTFNMVRPHPTIRVMGFEPGLQSVIVTPDKVRVEFEGSMVRQREFELV